MPSTEIHKRIRTTLVLWSIVALAYVSGVAFLFLYPAGTYRERMGGIGVATLGYLLIAGVLGRHMVRQADKAHAELQTVLRARRESEKRFRSLADATFEGVVIHEQWRVLEANRAMVMMFGYDQQELIGRYILDLVAPASLPIMRQHIASESEKPYEVIGVRKDGTSFAIEVIGRKLPYQNRTVQVAALRDITERKKAESELERSRSLLRATLESTADGILVIDRHGKIITYNRKFVELWRVPDFVLHAQEERATLAFLLDQLKDPEHFLNPEQKCHLLELKDGRIFECYAQPQWIAGNSGGRVCGFRDITEVKRAEAALRESEMRYRQMFENNQAVKLLVDPSSGVIVDANAAAAAFYGYPLEQLKQMNFTDINILPPEEVAAEMARAASEQRVYFQFRHRLASGEIRDVEIHSSPIDFQGRRLLFSIVHDTTERRRAEAALQRANEQLLGWVTELERRNYESSLLSEMGDLLQTCLSVEESYPIIAQSAQKLFPREGGALCIVTSSRTLVETVAVWGGFKVRGHVFAPNECWALRRGRIHRVEEPNTGLICRHLRGTSVARYVCIPLIAQGEALGVLHLESRSVQAGETGDGEFLTGSKERLAVAVAEHIALALANLKLRETLRSQAIRDPLTGLFNRRYMEESLERELRRATRSKHSLGVIMIDLDLFKRFNDTFGHAAGDALLRELGSYLHSQVRGEDIACRYGGEEFAIILPEAQLCDTVRRADQLREGIKQLSIRNGLSEMGGVSASLGIASFPKHGPSAEALLRAADNALYRAKSRGGDTVVAATDE